MKTAVLLATYNSEKYLSQMLSSLLNQTTQDFVCYIHDDGSKDGTLEVIKRFSENNPGRFELLEDGVSRLGAKGNFLHLLNSVEADLYFFADQDDVWVKDKMEKSQRALAGLVDSDDVFAAASSDIPLAVFTDMYVTDDKLNKTHDSFIRSLDRDPGYHRYTEIVMDNPAAGCTLCFNRACRDAAVFGGDAASFDRMASVVEMHDVWVLMTASVLGRVAVIDEPLVHYRQHGDNEMGARTETGGEKIKRNVGGLFGGDLSEKKKAYYDNAKALAAAALMLPGIGEDKKKVLEGFVHLSDMKKPARIMFLKNNGFRRKKHSLWIWLWA